MPDEALIFGEDAHRVATAMAAHLSASQQLGAGLLLAAMAIVLLVILGGCLDADRGPRR